MTTIAVTMVRDEADIIAATLANMLTQVDHVIVADNLSTDDTGRIAYELGATVIIDSDPAYRQSEKMTRLAEFARQRGADWIIPFDADEIWYSPFGRIGDVLEALPVQYAIATADLYDHVATGLDPNDNNPVQRIRWRRRERGALPKVACRSSIPVTIEQGNHSAVFPTDSISGQLVVRHYPYRSVEQFIRKAANGAAAYAATDLPEHVGQHWRGYGRILAEHGEEALADVFRRWFWVDDPTNDDTLILDPSPV